MLKSIEFISSVSLICTLTFVGCGRGKTERPVKVFPVTGQVTFQGQPVADADVTFFNADTQRSAFGRTDAEGRYRLTTFEANDGAVAGRQVVTVSKIDTPVDGTPDADESSAEYVPPVTTPPKRGKKPEKPKSLIPETYGFTHTSPLVVTVEESKKNVADLQLN